MKHNDDFGFFGKFFAAFGCIWVAAAVLGLGLTGVVIWAIIKLVSYLTS
jgi:hypothetical protein